jgi:hypothetical protein
VQFDPMADSLLARTLLYGNTPYLTPALDFLTNDSHLRFGQNVALGVGLGAAAIATGGALLEAAPGVGGATEGLGAAARSTGQFLSRLLANTSGAGELSVGTVKTGAVTIATGIGGAGAGVLMADHPYLPEQIGSALPEVESVGALAPEVESALAPAAQLSNLGQHIANATTAQYSSAQQLAQNYSRGMAFQNAVTTFLGGSNVRNTTTMVGQTASGLVRGIIPDIYIGGEAPIADVKDVLRISLTGQLQADIDLATMTGTSFNKITSVRNISVFGPLADAVRASGGFIFKFDPSAIISEVWDSAQNTWVPFLEW